MRAVKDKVLFAVRNGVYFFTRKVVIERLSSLERNCIKRSDNAYFKVPLELQQLYQTRLTAAAIKLVLTW